MKKMQYILAFLAMVGISSSTIKGHEYIFSNMIGDPIVLKINLAASTETYYQIIYPGRTVQQIFPWYQQALCLATTGIKWAPLSKTAPFNGGLDFVDKVTGLIPEDKQEEFGKAMHSYYVFFPVKIKLLPNDAFKALKDGAVKLLEGIDAFACQSLTEVKAFMGQTGGSTGGGMGGGGTGDQQKNKTTQTIELLGKLQTIISKIDIAKSTPLEKATAKNEIAALLTKDNNKLLTEIGKIPPLDITYIKEALNNVANHKRALIIVNTALYTILGLTPEEIEAELQRINQPTQPNQPTENNATLTLKLLGELNTIIKSVDLEKVTTLEKANATNKIVALLSSDNIKLLTETAKLTPVQISSIRSAVATNKEAQDAALTVIAQASETIAAFLADDTNASVTINTLMNTGGGTSTTIKKCDFGFGLIGKGAAKLAEHTLCTSREFIIYYDINEKDGLPMLDEYGQPALSAKTVAGQ